MNNVGIKFLNDAKIYALSPMVNKLIAIILIPIYTGYLSTEEYGRISYILLIGTIYVTVSGLGLGSAFWKYYKGTTNKCSKSKIVYISLTMQLLSGLAILIVLYLINKVYIYDDFSLIFIYLIGLTLNRIYEKGIALLQASHKAKKYIAITTLTSITRVALIIVVVTVMLKGYEGVIQAHTVTYVIASIVGCLLIRGKIKTNADRKLAKAMVVFSIPLMFGSIASIVMNAVDKIAINELLGKNDLGLYTFALNFGMLIKVFVLVPFFLAWTPFRWELFNSGNGREEKFSQMTKLVVTVFSAFGIAVGVLSIFVARILSQNQSYLASQDIIPLIAITQVLWGLYNYDLMGFYFSGKTKTIPMLILTLGAVNIILNAILIPIAGYRGAAIATLLSYCILRYVTAKISSKLFMYDRSLRKETLLVLVAIGLSIFLGKVALTSGNLATIMIMLISVSSILILAWRMSLIDKKIAIILYQYIKKQNK